MVLPLSSPAHPRELSNLLQGYVGRAFGHLETPGYQFTLEPTKVFQSAEKATNQLAAAELKDQTPALLVIDGHEPLRWEALIDALLKTGYEALGTAAVVTGGKQTPKKEPVTPLARSLDALDGVRRRLTIAISGAHPVSEEAKSLRSALYGGRSYNRTRAGYETEFEMVLSALRELIRTGRAPNGVKRMLPLLESALETLKTLPPTIPGRPAAPPAPPPHEVQLSTLALHLALGDLLSHASSTATNARLNNLTKLLQVRRPGDTGSVDTRSRPEPEVQGDFEPEDSEPVVVAPTLAVATPGPVASGAVSGAEVEMGAGGMGSGSGEKSSGVGEVVRS